MALKGHNLKTMSVQLRTHVNDLSAYVTKQLHPSETKRVVWKVYCGASRMSQVAESLGMVAWQFSLEMQSLGRRTPAQLEALRAARQFHHDRHLMFSKKVYL